MKSVAHKAPGRGRYDRDATAAERRASARSRLIDAVALALRDNGVHATVSDVVERAGVGRNTFYEHYPDLDAAAAFVRHRKLKQIVTQLDALLDSHHTPHQKIRALVSGWLDGLQSDDVFARALLVGAERSDDAVHRELADRVAAVAQLGKRDGAFAVAPDALRLDVAVATLVRCGRAVLAGVASRADAEALAYEVVCATFR